MLKIGFKELTEELEGKLKQEQKLSGERNRKILELEGKLEAFAEQEEGALLWKNRYNEQQQLNQQVAEERDKMQARLKALEKENAHLNEVLDDPLQWKTVRPQRVYKYDHLL